MMEDENIHDYHLNILDIANSFDSLGEKMSDEKLVRKIIRSLPKRFDMKVTSIEEAQDILSLKVNELIGSLQNFEININNKIDKKGNDIAFISDIDAEEAQRELKDNESVSEAIVLLGRLFNKILKQADWKPRSNGQNIKSNIDNQQDNVRKVKTNENINQSKGVQCHECEGHGHIRTECATYLKKQKKSLVVSWSNEDNSEGELENEYAKDVTTLTGVYTSDVESGDKELTYEELVISYKKLYTKSEDICKLLEKQKKTISQLHT